MISLEHMTQLTKFLIFMMLVCVPTQSRKQYDSSMR